MALDEADIKQVTTLIAEGIGTFEKGAFKNFADKVPTPESISAAITEALKGQKGEQPPPDSEDKKKIDPQTNAEVARLTKEVEKLTTAQKADRDRAAAAEKREQETAKKQAVTEAIAGFSFVDDEARTDAFDALMRLATRTDDGQIIVNNLPVADHAKSWIPEKKSYLLKPEVIGGSGATRGGVPGANQKAGTLEDISSDMSPEAAARVAASIVASLQGAQ